MEIQLLIDDDRLLFRQKEKIIYEIIKDKKLLSNELVLSQRNNPIVIKQIKSNFFIGKILVDFFFVERNKHYHLKINHLIKFSLKIEIEDRKYLLIYHPKQLVSIYCNDSMIGYIKNILPPYHRNVVKKIVLNNDVDLLEVASLVLGIVSFNLDGYSEPQFYFGFQLKKFDYSWKAM